MRWSDKPEEDVTPEDGEATPEGEDAIDTPDTEPAATDGAGESEMKPAPKPEAVKPPPAKKVNPAQPVLPTPTPEGATKPEPTPTTTPTPP